MTARFGQILAHYGRPVTLHRGMEVEKTRAFVQRIRKKDVQPPEAATNFGAADLRRWLYIGSKNDGLRAGDVVSFDGGNYVVQTAAAVYVGGEKSHWWAILRPEREVLS